MSSKQVAWCTCPCKTSQSYDRACMRMPFELSKRHVEGHHNRIIAVTERIAEAIEVVDHSVREADKQLVPVIACWVP